MKMENDNSITPTKKPSFHILGKGCRNQPHLNSTNMITTNCKLFKPHSDQNQANDMMMQEHLGDSFTQALTNEKPSML